MCFNIIHLIHYKISLYILITIVDTVYNCADVYMVAALLRQSDQYLLPH